MLPKPIFPYIVVVISIIRILRMLFILLNSNVHIVEEKNKTYVVFVFKNKKSSPKHKK